MSDRAIAANELERAAYWRRWTMRPILAPREVRKGRQLVRALVESARAIRLNAEKVRPV